MVAADAESPIGFTLTPGNVADGPAFRDWLKNLRLPDEVHHVICDKAYEGNETREAIRVKGLEPVVPPKSNRLNPWKYDKELYKERNRVERLFRRLKAFRRIFTRYDKLDATYRAFVIVGITYTALRKC